MLSYKAAFRNHNSKVHIAYKAKSKPFYGLAQRRNPIASETPGRAK